MGVLSLVALPAMALEVEYPDGTRNQNRSPTSYGVGGVRIDARKEGNNARASVDYRAPAWTRTRSDGLNALKNLLKFDHINFVVNSQLYNQNVKGNTSRSFKDEGIHLTQRLNLNLEKNYGTSGGRFAFYGDVRATNDQQIQPDKVFEALGAYGEFANEGDYSLRLGNVSANFSPYSFGQSADIGAHLKLEDLNFSRINLSPIVKRLELIGAQLRRPIANTAFQRMTYGAHVEPRIPIESLKQFGLNVVQTSDVLESLRTGERGTLRALKNTLFSASTQMGWGRTLLDVEAASSRTDDDLLNSARSQTGNAYRVLLSGTLIDRWGSFQGVRFSGAYENVEPEFNSVVGAGNPDNRLLRGSLDASVPRANLSLRQEASRSRNNLDGRLTSTNLLTTYTHRMSWQPLRNISKIEAFKNVNISVSFVETLRRATSGTLHSNNERQDFSLSTRHGRANMTTFFRYGIAGNKAGGTGNRRDEAAGVSYSFRDLDLSVVKSNINISARKNFSLLKDGSLSRTGQRSITARLENYLKRWPHLHLDAEYSRNLTTNSTPGQNIARGKYSIGLASDQFITPDGKLSLLVTNERTDEDQVANNFEEMTWKAEAEFKF